MVLSGCASGGGEEMPTTTTSSAAAGPVNPWDLPVEQRPALFDPCTELPVEAVEQGLGGPVEPIERFTFRKPGEMMACGWRTDQANISVLSTWKSRDEYLADGAFTVMDPEHELDGRIGMRLLDGTGDPEWSCIQQFYTERGATWLWIDLNYYDFKGRRVADACEALEQTIPPILAHFPKGDFR